MFQKIKTLFSLAGINNLTVKFEPGKELIKVNFDRAGKPVEETVSFKQVESFFRGQEGSRTPQDEIKSPDG